VGGQGDLVLVGGLGAGWRQHPGIVDDHVQVPGPPGQVSGKGADRGEVGHIAHLHPHVSVVQTWVVHVITNALRFVSYKHRRKTAAAMRQIYTASNPEAVGLALKEFDRDFGARYPGAVDVWRYAWNELVPFLDYPVEWRKIVYTANQRTVGISRTRTRR
jgi:hypothetical protein